MNLFPILLVVFFSVPLVEIYFLIQVGRWIGALPTVFMVVFTAVLGALLMRQQGLSTLQRAQLMLARGELPALELVEGVVLQASGALLLTPGFVTDTLGFLGLVPPVRRRLARWLLRHWFMPGNWPGGPRPPSAGPGGDSHIIEGEYRRED